MPSFIFMKVDHPTFFYSTHLLEYSLVVVSVVSIGHISTTALAAISLGSMTASVSGYSVISGLTSALDTVLPSAWTSNEPELVGLWAQRMGQSINLCGLSRVNWFHNHHSYRRLRISCSKFAGQEHISH
jgi:Na+-driven multidrug efflux pump